ncbi:MAG: autotransporter domain-containing protein, partial [Gallionellaceae bacterium]|nr:autotransporter domain-containing protein [Gallionellaceae bacterium]
ITNGGAASTGSAAIGGAIGSIGTANINGAGSNWTSSGQLYVGFNGTGTLNILNGGSVSDFLGMLGSAGGSSGSVIVSGAGSVWTHADDLIVGNSGAGTLILADGGRVVVGGDLLVGISGGQGTVNIGAVSGATPTAPGVLDAASVALDPTGSLVFNHTGAGYVFAPEILGNGVVRQLFGTTILTGGSGTFTGPTRVESGELRVNGSLAGSVVTVTGGVLGGTGTVGGLAVQADGTVAPGNSIGILNVAGDVVFNPGSIYAAEVDATAGQFDQIIATGAATLTGANLVVTPTGTFTPGSRYALITAGSVSGSFGSVTGLGGAPISAFVTPFASYDATHAYLEVDVTRAFADAAETHNQTAAAAGAQSLAVGNPLYLAVAMSADDEAAREAFDLLSGEIHASTQTMLIEDGRFARETALERAHSADGRNVWGRVYGSWADDRGNEEEAQIKRDIAGVFVGVDGEFNHWRVGVMAGYGQTDLKMDARSSSGKSDAYHLGVYGGTHFGAVGVRLGASYVRHDVSTNRAVEFDGYTDRLSAEYKANTTQVFGEAGYDFKVSEHTTVAPFVNLALVNHKMDSFVEHGSEAALSGEGGSTRTTFATVGLSAATKLDLGGVAATAKGVVGWHYAFGDVEMVFTHALAGGSVFTVHGVPVTENSMLVEAGLEFEMGKESALGISYNGLFGGDYADNGVMLDVNLKF